MMGQPSTRDSERIPAAWAAAWSSQDTARLLELFSADRL
jgi:hypothetical protein